MWIFSKTGFVSVTDNPSKPDTCLVRARTKEDLVDFIKTPSPHREFKVDAAWVRKQVRKIKETPARDYRWRVVLPKGSVQTIIEDQLDAIDYTNVKDATDKGEPARHAAMLRVWSAMIGLQEGEQAHTWGSSDGVWQGPLNPAWGVWEDDELVEAIADTISSRLGGGIADHLELATAIVEAHGDELIGAA